MWPFSEAVPVFVLRFKPPCRSKSEIQLRLESRVLSMLMKSTVLVCSLLQSRAAPAEMTHCAKVAFLLKKKKICDGFTYLRIFEGDAIKLPRRIPIGTRE